MTGDAEEPWTSALRAFARALAKELTRELAPLLANIMCAAPTPAVERRTSAGADGFLSALETCQKYGFSRATFDRMLRDSASGLGDVVVRVPPVTGRVRVPVQAFEAWLRASGRTRPKRAKQSRRVRATPVRLDSSRASSVHAPADAAGDGR